MRALCPHSFEGYARTEKSEVCESVCMCEETKSRVQLLSHTRCHFYPVHFPFPCRLPVERRYHRVAFPLYF